MNYRQYICPAEGCMKQFKQRNHMKYHAKHIHSISAKSLENYQVTKRQRTDNDTEINEHTPLFNDIIAVPFVQDPFYENYLRPQQSIEANQ